ncbi:ECF transporter S component [Candidatus Gracilibacteria bacterium]|nr:ECF transporter S component [Candidatus Gracilibacteria bacterium]
MILKLIPSYNLGFQNISLANKKYYVLSIIFTILNIVTPIFFHQFGMGGPMFLPIYFFVLIGGYKYGWKVGVLTALLSPTISHFITGMPNIVILDIIIIKGVLLGLISGYIGFKTNKLSLINLIYIVVIYQLLGSIYEMSINDIVIGYPGLLLQIFGGYYLIKIINKYDI